MALTLRWTVNRAAGYVLVFNPQNNHVVGKLQCNGTEYTAWTCNPEYTLVGHFTTQAAALAMLKTALNTTLGQTVTLAAL